MTESPSLSDAGIIAEAIALRHAKAHTCPKEMS